MANRWEKKWKQWQNLFSWATQITADGDWNHEIKRHLLLGNKSVANLDSVLKIRDIAMPTKLLLIRAMIFPVVMYRCEIWAITKAEHQRTDSSSCGAVDNCWASPGQKEIKPINTKGSQSWIFIGRTDAEAEGPILLPPDVKSRLIEKDPDSGKDCEGGNRDVIEDEMVGWHLLSTDVSLNKLWEIVKDREVWPAVVMSRVRHDLVTE